MKKLKSIIASVVFFFSGHAFALEASMTGVSFDKPIGGSVVTTKLTVDKQGEEAALAAVGSSEIEATIIVNGDKMSVRGRSSFHFNASSRQLESGSLELGALNIVFFDVKQSALNYTGDRDEKTGTLSFVLSKPQSVKYDARRGILSGQVDGYIGADYMKAFAKEMRDSKDGDSVEAVRQRASMEVSIRLGKPLALRESKEPQRTDAEMDLSVRAENDQRISAYDLRLIARPVFEIEYIFWPRIEIANRLCVQPVRFRKFIWTPPTLSQVYTGAGLAFGQPEANKQWAKADVVFTWRPWKTIFSQTLFDFSIGEQYDVMDTVDDADCVEVFFVNGDNGMHNNWGGGASFWGGESYTKIISSDGNAAGGIDKVHLAHELGHSMDLPHPTYYNSSSTNTLMCPSGFANDNPARNSQENKDNISNPLFTFALKLVSAGPDCNDSADCGSCP